MSLKWLDYSSRRRLLTLVKRSSYYRYASTQTPKLYDVVIIGGGPAGLSLAAGLKHFPASSGLNVALVEGSDLDKIRNHFDPQDEQATMEKPYSNRVSSLTPATTKYLKEIGAWSNVIQDRVQEVREMRILDGVSGAAIEFETEQDEPISRMCENFNLQFGLLKTLEHHKKGLDIYSKTKVTSIKKTGQVDDFDLSSWPKVELDNGHSLAARLLVGADGANSPVRKFAGIESRGWDYDTFGIVASLEIDEPWSETAWQRFLPTGPIALLPLPDRKATLVWSAKTPLAKHLLTLSPGALSKMITAALHLSTVDLEYLSKLDDADKIADEIEWRLSVLPANYDNVTPPEEIKVVEGTVAGFPLRMRHADSYIAERVALIGDAAHTTHPLAGQGLNQGQSDMQALVSTINDALGHGQDIGSLLSLEPYWAASYPRNHVMLGVVDKLHKLYSTDNPSVVSLRSFGLDVVNQLDWFKSLLMKGASG